MKAYIRITNEKGLEFEGEAELSPVAHDSATNRRATKGKKPKAAKISTTPTTNAKLVFTKPERAFVKAYARGLNGQKKFALLLAYLAKGEKGREVELKEVEKRWNKMKAPNLFGAKFNRFYPTVAKEHGWVDSPRHGVYVLTESWQEIFEDNG